MTDATYDGTEIGIELDIAYTPFHDDLVFDIRPQNYSKYWKPIYDEEVGAIIGYQEGETTRRIYDLEGNFVTIEETPLEPSYIIEDIILLFVGITEIKYLLKGGAEVVVATGRSLGRAAAYGLTAGVISKSALTGLRIAFRALLKKEIFKFTGTTAARMSTPGRYVPPHILYLVVKYGKKMADPQGAAGAMKFVHELISYNKKGELTKYTLEVVIRMKDWTVLHFLYK